MLESWGDEQPVKGFYSIRQPAVRPLANSRQAEDILLWLAATAGKNMPFSDYRAYLKKEWKRVYDVLGTNVSYDVFYQGFLRRGHIGKLVGEPVSPLKDIKPHLKSKKQN
ncbi:MAG: hypothetical protein R3B45_05655 [Bdellovibrionota bacterium]